VSGAAPPSSELVIRRRLGIPADAARVLVLAESSHWDANWLLTSDEHHAKRVPSFCDTGGLWRMGHEYRGGSFTEHGEASVRLLDRTLGAAR
jgi:hypothetical protein